MAAAFGLTVVSVFSNTLSLISRGLGASFVTALLPGGKTSSRPSLLLLASPSPAIVTDGSLSIVSERVLSMPSACSAIPETTFVDKLALLVGLFFVLFVPMFMTRFPRSVFLTRPKRKIAIVLAAADAPTRYRPTPQATPTAALTQMAAAVVNPFTEDCRSYTPLDCRLFVMTPAPMKPTPLTILLAIRLRSTLAPATSDATERKPYIEQMVKAAAPKLTRAIVRTPAGLSDEERSRPTAAPPSEATTSRRQMSISAFVGNTRRVPSGRTMDGVRGVATAASETEAAATAVDAAPAELDSDINIAMNVTTARRITLWRF
mmetsp:Transcript_30366/g.88782  ORF Transcript_30366/g.88782 Transcript_30366/m.88782 type:complete len:319 (-) Transcript_30366:487-1443(-)